MDENLKEKFAWAEDGNTHVAYFTDKEKQHWRLAWTSDTPKTIYWAKCKCRGCLRMQVEDEGSGSIPFVLNLIGANE